MPSYQDIETRLQAVERKLEFVMRAFTVAKKEGIVDQKLVVKNLLEIYHEVNSAGVDLASINVHP